MSTKPALRPLNRHIRMPLNKTNTPRRLKIVPANILSKNILYPFSLNYEVNASSNNEIRLENIENLWYI